MVLVGHFASGHAVGEVAFITEVGLTQPQEGRDREKISMGVFT